MESGAQPGNDNAKKGAEWRQAIKRALTRASDKLGDGDEVGYRKGLDIVADKFVAASCEGEAWAMKELGDRIDGKPAQSVNVKGDVAVGVHYLMEFPENGDDSSEDAT